MATHLSTICSAEELRQAINRSITQSGYSPLSPARYKFLTTSATMPHLYRHFTIPKRHGGGRKIDAPKKMMQAIQSTLLPLLEGSFVPSSAVCGFVKNRSVVNNALPHIGCGVLLNIDIKDFFPSITHQMVTDALVSELKMGQEAAHALAWLCTIPKKNQRVLPQGSSTSPILSNIVCSRMDRELLTLCAAHGVTYTRYADDLSFSAKENCFEAGSEFRQRMEDIIKATSLKLNNRKTHIAYPGRRMEVTGLVVERRANVARDYILELRQLLYIWEKYGEQEAAISFSKHHGDRTHRSPIRQIIQGKLAFMSQVRGNDDPIVKRYRSWFERLKKRPRKQQRKATPPPQPTPVNPPAKGGCLGMVALLVGLSMLMGVAVAAVF